MRKEFTADGVEGLDHPAKRRDGDLELRIAGFHDDWLDKIRDVSCVSPRVEELAESFPALLFAFATGYGTTNNRHAAFRLVLEGAPLKDVAAALKLPQWLRRLPAQAFTSPLRPLPDGAEFARRITNLIPRSPVASAMWFERVSDAYALAGVDYMLWMARHKQMPFCGDGNQAKLLMGVWAWASQTKGTTAHNLLRLPWRPDMSVKRAFEEARAWERRVDLAITLGRGQADTWFKGSTVNGLEFVPLRSVEDFLAESQAMGNCLDQYATPINNTHVRVFSIRRDGETVANIELAPHDDDCLMPGIEQLRGPRNNRAAPDVWQAAYAWLGQQSFRVFPGPSHGGRTDVAAAWDRVWAPVLDGIKYAPMRKQVRQFARLAHGSAGVQREASRVNLEF